MVDASSECQTVSQLDHDVQACDNEKRSDNLLGVPQHPDKERVQLLEIIVGGPIWHDTNGEHQNQEVEVGDQAEEDVQSRVHPLREALRNRVLEPATVAWQTPGTKQEKTNTHKYPVLVLDSDVQPERPFVKNYALPDYFSYIRDGQGCRCLRCEEKRVRAGWC